MHRAYSIVHKGQKVGTVPTPDAENAFAVSNARAGLPGIDEAARHTPSLTGITFLTRFTSSLNTRKTSDGDSPLFSMVDIARK